MNLFNCNKSRLNFLEFNLTFNNEHNLAKSFVAKRARLLTF